MSTVEEIRRNVPLQTSVVIDMDEDHSLDAPIIEALQQNPYITTINLIIGFGGTPRNWPRLLRHLGPRNNLQQVRLYARITHIEHAMLLQAIQQNTNVRDFTISSIGISVATLVPFLNAATHITDLWLNCTFHNNNGTMH